MSKSVYFLLGVAGSLVVIGFWIGQIDSGMGHIKIAAHNYWLLLIQFPQISGKVFIPLLPIFKAGQSPAGIGNIHIDGVIIIKFGSNHAAFLVVFLQSYAKSYFLRLDLGKDGRSGIAAFFRGTPVLIGIGDCPNLSILI